MMHKMLPRSHRWAYVGYDEGSKSVKYYNAETRGILTSWNFKFLTPSNSSPPEVILINPESKGPSLEGECEENTRNEQQTTSDNDLVENDKPAQPSKQPMGLTRPSR